MFVPFPLVRGSRNIRTDSGLGVSFLLLLRLLTSICTAPAPRLCNLRRIQERKALSSSSVSVISNSVNQKVSRPQEQSNPPSLLPPYLPASVFVEVSSQCAPHTHTPINSRKIAHSVAARTVCLLLPKYHLRVKLNRAAREIDRAPSRSEQEGGRRRRLRRNGER